MATALSAWLSNCLLLVGLSLLVGIAGERLPLSSHQCVDGVIGFCTFENVFLYAGRLHYVAERGAEPDLPKLTLRYWVVGVSHEDLWLEPVVVGPDAAASLPLPPAAEWVQVDRAGEEAYLWSTLSGWNYGHDVGEFLPSLANTLCRHLGRCTYANRTGLHIFSVYSGSAGDVPHPVLEEGLRCITDVPLEHIGSEAMRGRVTWVRRLSAGVGNDCRARLFCGGRDESMTMGRKSITPKQMRLYRDRMGACLGFDPAARAAVRPKVQILVVDRHYSSGRHMLNLHEVMKLLRERYGGVATITKKYMEDLSLLAQARLWNGASIVLHVHGASLGNYAFLPLGALAVHIVTRPGGVGHDNQFPAQLVADLKGTSDIAFLPLNNTDMAYARIQSEKVWRDPNWQLLSPAQKVGVMEGGDCEQLLEVGSHLPGHCGMFWLLKAMDIVVDPELVAEVMDRALAKLQAAAAAAEAT